MGVNGSPISPRRNLGIIDPYINPKYYGLKIDFKGVIVCRTISPKKTVADPGKLLGGCGGSKLIIYASRNEYFSPKGGATAPSATPLNPPLQKNDVKNEENQAFLYYEFFHIFFPLFILSHIPIDRARLALQNYLYDIFLLKQNRREKIKILFFGIFKNLLISSILPE